MKPINQEATKRRKQKLERAQNCSKLLVVLFSVQSVDLHHLEISQWNRILKGLKICCYGLEEEGLFSPFIQHGLPRGAFWPASSGNVDARTRDLSIHNHQAS